MAKKDIDITQTGPAGFRQLQEANNLAATQLSPEFQEFREGVNKKFAPVSSFDPLSHADQNLSSGLPEDNMWGESKYDNKNANEEEFRKLADNRGRQQGGLTQVANGLAKGAVLAGTTFLDGTVGLLYGGVSAIKDGKFSSVWDNEFSRAMQAINEYSEKAMPNYYTDAELEDPWQKHWFSTNFLGDKFLKNMGFTVGAFYSGNVVSSALGAAKIPKLIGMLTKSSQAPKIVMTGVGASVSAFNEGRIEAINNSKEWEKPYREQIEQEYNAQMADIEQYKNTEMYNTLASSIEAEKQEKLTALTKERALMGNHDLVMNLPILLASNVIQFGRMYANGFKTSRNISNLAGTAGKYATQKTLKKGAVRASINALSEGTEELTQGMASAISGDYSGTKFDNFLAAKRDPEAEQQTVDFWKSFSKGIVETWNDNNSWEEFTIGALTGALGMPSFRNIKGENGGYRSPITMKEGFIGEFKEYKDNMKREAKVADYLNTRFNDPEFLNYYQGLIRHNKYQNDMDKATVEDNEFDFRTAAHSQLVSDIAMFDNAGKLEDLYDMIENSFSTDDENLKSIIENTTTTSQDENGKNITLGPFIDKDGNSMLRTPQTKQEMVNKLEKHKAEILNTVESYKKSKADIDILTGQKLSDEQLEELTWMKVKTEDWKARATQLTEEIQPIIRNIGGEIDAMISYNQGIINEEGSSNKGITDTAKQAEDLNKKLSSINNGLKALSFSNPWIVSQYLESNPKYLDAIKDFVDNGFGSLSTSNILDLERKINDIPKLTKAAQEYNKRLKQYYDNPGKLQAELDKITEEQAKETKEKAIKGAKDSLKDVTSVQEFRKIYETVDHNSKEGLLDTLIGEGNEFAKNYKDLDNLFPQLRSIILNEEKYSAKEKDDIWEVLDNHISNSNTLQEALTNKDNLLDGSILYDENLSEEENYERHTRAVVAINEAINKLIESKEEASKFTDKPIEPSTNSDFEMVDNIDDLMGGTTETSGEQTTKSTTTGTPVQFDMTEQGAKDENQELNDRTEDTKLPTDEFGIKEYYFPIIPQLESTATKNGDYRTYKEVKADQGLNFSKIYDFLDNKGAFDYVNEGNMKQGDKVGFMIDPTYDNSTIFMIDPRNNQIIGSVPVKGLDGYIGLTELQNRIKEGFNKTSKDAPYIHNEQVTLDKMMLGKVPYTESYRTLKDIPNIKTLEDSSSKEGFVPKFALVKNGALFTNGKVDSGKIVSPHNLSKKEGYLYVLIPNSNGTYTPSSLNIKHFNEGEFNYKSLETQGTATFKQIEKAVDLLARAVSADDVNSAWDELRQVLYLGDVHFEFDTIQKQDVITFRKTEKDSKGKDIYDTDTKGNKYRREQSHVVKLTLRENPNFDGELNDDGTFTAYEATPVDYNTIKEQIYNVLYSYNLPIQVESGKLNEDAYTNRLLNDGILNSNMKSAEVQGAWFTTSVLDAEGNPMKANSPKRVPAAPSSRYGSLPVVIIGDNRYSVDLSTGTIKDSQGNDAKLTKAKHSLIQEIAWADTNFGSTTDNEFMIDNKVLTPSGKILDRTNNKYLSEGESNKVKTDLAKRKANKRTSEETVNLIISDQANVDKGRTDNKSYFIKEEDGKYHPYDRVHTRIGSNWIISPAQQKFFDTVQSTLSKLSEDIAGFNEYLRGFKDFDSLGLEKFLGKVDVQSRAEILQTIKDNNLGTKGGLSLKAGSAVDTVVRDFFHTGKTTKPDIMQEKAYMALLESLEKIKKSIELSGERFLTNNIVLYHKYADGTRIAGEVDILAIDKNGNFKIYDVKTSKYSFHPFVNKHGNKVDYFNTKSDKTSRSTRDQYTLQLSAYKNILESHYGAPVVTLSVLPYVLSYVGEEVSNVTQEAGLPIIYNKDVNVPLEGVTKGVSVTKEDIVTKPVNEPVAKPTSSSTSNPVSKPTEKVIKKEETKSFVQSSNNSIPSDGSALFNSSVEIARPINDISEHTEIKGANSKVGYFELNGVLHKGNLVHVPIEGYPNMYITKTVVLDKGFGKENSVAFPSERAYHLVLPNGLAKNFVTFKGGDRSLGEIIQSLKQVVNQAGVQKMSDFASQPTIVSQFTLPVSNVETKVEKPTDIVSSSKNASESSVEARIQKPNDGLFDEYEDDFSLRVVTNTETKMWNREKELKWIERVLPQLSTDNKVKVVSGLINAGSNGTYAWGLFKDGMIILSDIAAEGTAYHEAFHYVFQSLLDNNARAVIFEEARAKYGSKSDNLLEENLAEGFREYMLSRDNQGLGARIIRFFKSLFTKIQNWNTMTPHLDYLYQQINAGNYSTNQQSLIEKDDNRIYAFHGTGANSIKEFDNKFLLSGEGATAYTSGFYFTQGDLESKMYRIRALAPQLKNLGLPQLSKMVDTLNTISAKYTMRSEEGITPSNSKSFSELIDLLKNNPTFEKDLKDVLYKITTITTDIKDKEAQMRDIKTSKTLLSKVRRVSGYYSNLYNEINKLKQQLYGINSDIYTKAKELEDFLQSKKTVNSLFNTVDNTAQAIGEVDDILTESINISNSILNSIQGGNRYITSFRKDLNLIDLDSTDIKDFADSIMPEVDKLEHSISKGGRRAIVLLERLLAHKFNRASYETGGFTTPSEYINLVKRESLKEDATMMDAIRLLEYLNAVQIGLDTNVSLVLNSLPQAQKEVTKLLQNRGFQGATHKSGFSGAVHHIIYDSKDIRIEKSSVGKFNPNYSKPGVKSLDFNSLDAETLQHLRDKGWTQEMWNTISKEEKELAIKCS